MTPRHIDGLVRIKNAYLAGLESCNMPHSKFLEQVLGVMQKKGKISSFETVKVDEKNTLQVSLLYHGKTPAFTNLKLYSKPGRRIYIGYDEIKPIKSGLGIALVSSPQGVLETRDARKAQVGGELLFACW